MNIATLGEIIIDDDILVTVPNDLTLMTPYVLYEQKDWFEDEMNFVRQYVKPGMKVLDIGANYGVYALSMAKKVGDQGWVWAFEPTAATFSCLEKSVKSNAFENISILKYGVSNRAGPTQLFTSANGELNSLSQESVVSSDVEEIELTTLDHCYELYDWDGLDFIKLDAEGEEVRILEAAETLMAEESPLFMFELKHGKSVNVALVRKFRQAGYDTYRLIPSLNILVPFDEKLEFDGFLLNLFCCKKDKADCLVKTEVILMQDDGCIPLNFDYAAELILSDHFSEDLKITLNFIGESTDENYVYLLSAYIAFLSDKYTLQERLSYLTFSLAQVKLSLGETEIDVGKLSTYSRIAFDAGERVLGVNILLRILDKYPDNLNFELEAPYLPAHASYDAISHEGKERNWFLSAVLEKYIEKHTFSTYFTGRKSSMYYSRLQQLGFMADTMVDRYALMQKVFK